MLLNNLHALRVHTQGLFEDMGGEEVGQALQCVLFVHVYLCSVMHTFVPCTTCKSR